VFSVAIHSVKEWSELYWLGNSGFMCLYLRIESITVSHVLFRFYLKRSEAVPEYWQASDRHTSPLLQLNVNELGHQLTDKDFQLFRNIEPTEYLADLFHCDSEFGTPNLSRFAKVSVRQCSNLFIDAITVVN